MVTNPMLLALLESSNASVYLNEATEEKDEEDQASNEEEEDTTQENDDNDSSEENEEESSDDNTESDNQQEDGEDDPFSFDNDEEEDDGPNPDGLPDPDDVGDDSVDDAEEKNVQTNILNLSSLDRNLVKRRLFNNFKDLRTSIDSFRTTVDDREEVLDSNIRNATITKLGDLYEKLTEYLMYKFSYINYEENLENFILYTKKFNEIIQVVIGDDKHDNKSTKKKSSSRKNFNSKL